MKPDYRTGPNDVPTLPSVPAPNPLAVSDMMPKVPEPDYDALKKPKRGGMSLSTVAAIQKTYEPPSPNSIQGHGSPQVKPPTSGLKDGWKGRGK